ncbi:MAG: DUF58 domain-containing protein [Chloroflexi bacterium]|nr:DUF58 domain-containing protein [Chloroflexota bacterium]
MINELWFFVAAILVLIGLVSSQGLLMVLGSMVIIMTLTAKLWEKYAFRRVTHYRTLSQSRAFIGDTLEYTVTLSNDKVLPLIWVDMEDPFPEGLQLIGAKLKGTGIEVNRQHSIATSLLPYQKASWKYTLKCAARGYHRIGPVRLRSGDIFGFTSVEVHLSALDHVLVYPRVVDLDQLIFPEQNPMGDARGKRPLYQDQSRFLALRDYLPTDPMKHIDWKASARHQSLQTKVFEPVVSLKVLIAMNATTSEHSWQGSNLAFFERTVTAAASVASYCSGLGYSFGLASNAVASFSGKWLTVPLGSATTQLTMVLEALAMAGPYSVTSIVDVLKGERTTLPVGATVVLITAIVTRSLVQEVAEIKERGYQVLVLYTGDGSPEMDLAGVEVFRVGRALRLSDTDTGNGGADGDAGAGANGRDVGNVLEKIRGNTPGGGGG